MEAEGYLFIYKLKANSYELLAQNGQNFMKEVWQ